MLSTLATAGRTVLKRMAADWLIVGAAFATITLATILLAAGPIYADAVTIAALQRSIGDAPISQSTIEATIRVFPEVYETVDGVVRATVNDSLDATGADVFAHLEAESFGFEDRPTSGRLTELASFHYFEDLANRATLTKGDWPMPGDDRVETAVNAPAAEMIGLEPGDALVVRDRQDPDIEVIVRVVGIYEAHDPRERYWRDDELISSGHVDSGSFRHVGPFVVAREDMLEHLTPRRTIADWRIVPDFELLAVQEVDGLRQRVTDLDRRLDAALSARVDAASNGARDGFTVDTELTNLLTEVDRSLTVTRSSVLALLIQLSILAGYALVLTATLLVDTRRTETNLARSRGTSPRQILAASLLEGLVLTLPVVLAGPFLASLLLSLLNQVGPLATIDLTIEPRVTPESFVLAGIAASLSVIVLGWPAYRSARRFGSSLGRSPRQSSRAGTQRIGVDLALVTLAVLAFWQLQSLGPGVSSRVRGQFGLDPLLILAPAVALLAGAILALRLIPLLARAAETIITSRRSAVTALASWQVARRPVRYARASLLLMLAVGIGFFAASYSTTWIASQRDQAAHAVGADVAVVPSRATGSSLTDLHLSTAQRSIPGVTDVMPVLHRQGQLAGDSRLAQVVILDASRASEVVALRADLAPDFSELMQTLARARPSLATVPIPDEPTAINLELVAIEERPESEASNEGDADTTATEADFNARLRLVLQDADGLLHRLEAGRVPVNQGVSSLSVALRVPHPDGSSIQPAYPLALVAIEIHSVLPEGISRSVELTLRELSVGEEGTDNEPRLVEVDWADMVPSVNQVVGTVTRPSIEKTVPEGTDMLRLAIDTGSGFGTAPAVFALRPAGTTLPATFPVVVSSTFPETNFVDVGGETRVPPLRIARDGVTVAGTIGSFPGIDADGEVIIADLPTYLMMGYEPESTIPQVDGYRLATDSEDVEAITGALEAPPLDSFRVDSIRALSDTLVSDPVALGSIGALTVGFVAAAVFAAVGFAVSATVSARERLVEFALLRAVGLSPRQLGFWLSLEQGVLVVASVVSGTLIGVLMTALLLPLVTLTQDGGPPEPEVLVVYPWDAVIGMELAVLGVLGVIVLAMTILLRRVGLGSLLRLGED